MILLITRKYPPSVGGMQQLSYHLTQAVGAHTPTQVVKWGGSQIWLPLFIPYALARALLILWTKPVTLIHLGDLVLAPLGLFLRFVVGRPVVANAHGLDVIYPSRFYQAVIPRCARRLDYIICNSEHTRQQCLARGVLSSRSTVIPVGVEPEAFKTTLPKAEQSYWMEQWGLQSTFKHVLLTTGRLVRRKGVLFFVSQVLPRLSERRDDWIYLIVGDGPEHGTIGAAVHERGLEECVRILGQVPPEELQAAYAMADVFVMPNVQVQNDSEGFGIVAVEARVAGLRVVASALEGIVDSFESSEDGVLVPSGDTEAFVEAIDRVLETPQTPQERQVRRQRAASRYSWGRIVERYLAVFSEVQARYYQSRPIP